MHPSGGSEQSDALRSALHTLHDALHMVRPKVLKKKMLAELLAGADEVNILQQELQTLRHEQRLIHEQLAASQLRLHNDKLELRSAGKHQTSCDQRVEKWKQRYCSAQNYLESLPSPSDYLQAAKTDIANLTPQKLLDLLSAIDSSKSQRYKNSHISTCVHPAAQYVFDCIGLFLMEPMTSVKECNIKVPFFDDISQTSNESHSILSENTALSIQMEGSAGSDESDSENASVRDHFIQHQVPRMNETDELDPVALAAQQHRSAIGLDAHISRTDQQKSFIAALSGGRNGSVATQQLEEQTESDAKIAVKAYAVEFRRSVIGNVGQESWKALTFVQRLRILKETEDAELSQEQNLQREPILEEISMSYLRSSFDKCFRNSLNKYPKTHRRKGKLRDQNGGYLCIAKLPNLPEILTNLCDGKGTGIVSALNPETLELLEPLLEIGRMAASMLHMTLQGRTCIDMWNFVWNSIDFVNAKANFDPAESKRNRAHELLQLAQQRLNEANIWVEDIKDLIASRNMLIPRISWQKRRQDDRIRLKKLSIKKSNAVAGATSRER